MLPGRSEGGTRIYSEEDVARFEAIVALSGADVPLDALSELARIRPSSKSGDAASKRVGTSLTNLATDIEGRIHQLQAALSDLRVAESRLVACHGCRKRPTRRACDGCAVSPTLLASQVMRIVWDQDS